jgi:hypothetical protein
MKFRQYRRTITVEFCWKSHAESFHAENLLVCQHLLVIIHFCTNTFKEDNASMRVLSATLLAP